MERQIMQVEELAKWLFFGYRDYVLRGTLTPVEWEDIAESAREDWRNFAEHHKQVFYTGDQIAVLNSKQD